MVMVGWHMVILKCIAYDRYIQKKTRTQRRKSFFMFIIRSMFSLHRVFEHHRMYVTGRVSQCIIISECDRTDTSQLQIACNILHFLRIL